MINLAFGPKFVLQWANLRNNPILNHKMPKVIVYCYSSKPSKQKMLKMQQTLPCNVSLFITPILYNTL